MKERIFMRLFSRCFTRDCFSRVFTRNSSMCKGDFSVIIPRETVSSCELRRLEIKRFDKTVPHKVFLPRYCIKILSRLIYARNFSI